MPEENVVKHSYNFYSLLQKNKFVCYYTRYVNVCLHCVKNHAVKSSNITPPTQKKENKTQEQRTVDTISHDGVNHGHD